MSKKIQLQIPVPCHEDWDQMTPVEKGRFCGSCQKQVVDFSNMSDRQIAMFFKKPSTGSVCGRFMSDQLDREMEIPKKRIPWFKYFFHFLLPGFLLSIKATAQIGKIKIIEKKEPINQSSCSDPKLDITSVRGLNLVEDSTKSVRIVLGGIKRAPFHKQILNKNAVINGTVINDKGSVIPYSTILIKGTKTGIAADANGRFSVNPESDWENITLVVSCVGFESKEIKLNRSNFKNNLQIKLTSIDKVGEVVVVNTNTSTRTAGMVSCRVTRPRKIKQLQPPADIPLNKFKVYPNPALSGSELNIEWKQQPGDYTLQLFNQSGQLILTKEMHIDKGARLLTLDLPSLTAGSYFLKINHKGSGKSYTEKIIVQ